MQKIRYTKELPSAEDFFNIFLTTSWNNYYLLEQDELYTVIEKSWLVVCAYIGEKLVGTGRVVSDGVHAIIYDLIILPDHQKKSIGSTILNMLIEECNKNKVRDIQLFCAKGKRSFYEINGFVIRPDDAPGMELSHDH